MSDWKNKKLNHMNNPDMSFTTLMQSYREIQITYDAPHAKPGFFFAKKADQIKTIFLN